MKNNTQTGRTMIEVIAYLGILGILAVGIYSGYRIAERKLRTDQTINTVHDLIQDIRTAHNTKRFYTQPSSGNFVTPLIKDGVIPVNLCATHCDKASTCDCNDITKTYGTATVTGALRHPLGGLMDVRIADDKDATDVNEEGSSIVGGDNKVSRRLKIILHGITRKTCFPIASADWNSSGETINVVESVRVNKGATKGTRRVKFPVPMSEVMDNDCATASDKEYLSIVFTIR